MAAPTSVRVEATSLTTAVLRWVHSGSAGVSVYRSTDGSSYASIVDGLSASATSYTDTGLSTATKYWYKLTDDAGSTFSSVVTVYTMTCGSPPHDAEEILPRAGDEVVQPEVFNDLAVRVESGLVRFRDPNGRTCTACITDGALVIDCVDYDHCEVVEVEVDQDINSISLPNCDNDLKQINFLIPPNTTRGICGWPGGGGFTGDECFQAPISGGSSGRTMSVPTRQGRSDPNSKSKPGYGRGNAGSGSGGSGCTCVPNGNGALTIKSCNANNSLNCSSSKKLQLIACGGKGPYTWSKTGSVTLQVGDNGTPGTTATGSTVIVKPPTNSGSAVAGEAYTECHFGNNGANGCNTQTVILNDVLHYGCNDNLINCDNISFNCVVPSNQLMPCISGLGSCSIPECTNCTTHNDFKQPAVDNRTAGMISNGCNPCGVQAGATVSVTDALGTVASVVLRN